MRIQEKEEAIGAGRSVCSITALALLLTVALGGPAAHAHTPLLYIEDNGDGTIYVEGGFSDGSSGAGMALRLEDADGQSLWDGTLDDFGSIESVPIPDVSPYFVIFDGGPGHVVRKEGISYAAVAEQDGATVPDSGSDASIVAEGEQSSTSSLTASAQSPTAAAIAQIPDWSPAATLSPGWSSGTSLESEGTTYAPVLWAIVGLLSFVALQLLLLGGGVLFLAGWKVGAHRGRRTETEWTPLHGNREVM